MGHNRKEPQEMKTIIEPWRKLFKEIDDSIAHSQKEGLPLKSIELDAEEWEIFTVAFEKFKVARSLLGTSIGALRKYNETRYKRIKIYKEKVSV
jgi:hypothetical protein